MAWHRLLQPLLAEKGYASLAFLLFKKQGEAASGFVGKYSDNWIGPVFSQMVDIPYPRTEIIFVLEHLPQPGGHHARIEIELFIAGQKVAKETRSKRGQFSVKAVVERGKISGPVNVELRTKPCFIPRLISNTPDDRRLSVLHLETIVRAAKM